MPPRQNASNTSMLIDWNYSDTCVFKKKKLLLLEEIRIKHCILCPIQKSLTDITSEIFGMLFATLTDQNILIKLNKSCK